MMLLKFYIPSSPYLLISIFSSSLLFILSIMVFNEKKLNNYLAKNIAILVDFKLISFRISILVFQVLYLKLNIFDLLVYFLLLWSFCLFYFFFLNLLFCLKEVILKMLEYSIIRLNLLKIMWELLKIYLF